MIYLVAIIPTLILAYLLWQERKDTLVREKEWALERGALLQRIQAPERAVLEEWTPAHLEQGVPFDDDEAFHAAKAELREHDGNI